MSINPGQPQFDPINANVAVLDYGALETPPNLYRVSEWGSRLTPIGEVRCSSAYPMIFANISHGLMICNGSTTAVRRSSDGGATWANVSLPRS